MVEIGDLAHVVMGDGVIRMSADDRGLHPVEFDHHVRSKATKSHLMRRVRLGHGQVRQADLVKAGIVHRPEHIAPGAVQGLRRLVTLGEPVAKGLQRHGRIGQNRVVAGIFVIGLPGGDMRVAAIAPRENLGDAGAFGAVAFMREIIVPARAEPARAALAVMGQHIWMAVQHPAGRRGGGGAQDHFQPGRPQRVDRAVQPVKLQLARLRFHPRPGELADPDPSQAKRGHAGGVCGPLGFLPMFGVIADPKGAFEWRGRHGRNRCSA